MATYPPPTYTEPLSIFNPIYFESDETLITIDYANKHYLKFPVAQGTETLQQIIVNGASQFNNNISVGSSSTANLTPFITTNKAELLLGTGGQGEVNVECPIYVGGFGSIQLQSSVLTLDSNAYINQGATNTTANSLGLTNITKPLTMSGALNTDRLINTAFLQLANENSLATNAGVINGSGNSIYYETYNSAGTHIFRTNNGTTPSNTLLLTNTDLTIATTNPPTCNASSTIALSDDSAKLPSTAWVKDYVASVPSTIPANLTPTSLTISPPSNPSPSAGIYNNYNMGAVYSFSGTGGFNNSYTGTFVANGGCKWDFNYNFIPAGIVMKYRINFTFWSGGSWGQTKCDIDFYPNRWSQGQQLNDKYNINNKIDGNDSFGYSNATYAPSGRQYWTYNQAFSGVSGANANFIPHQGYFQLYFTIPNSSYSWSGCIEALDTTSPQAGGMGIRIVAV